MLLGGALGAGHYKSGQGYSGTGRLLLGAMVFERSDDAAARELLGRVQRHPRRHMLEVLVAGGPPGD